MPDNSELIQRVAVLEERAKNSAEKIEALENGNEVIQRLTALMEVQVDTNKDNKEQMREQHNTLVQVNQNLFNLNTKMGDIDSRVGRLEQSDNDDKIDLGKFFKDLIFKVVPTVIATLVAAWFIIQFGLK